MNPNVGFFEFRPQDSELVTQHFSLRLHSRRNPGWHRQFDNIAFGISLNRSAHFVADLFLYRRFLRAQQPGGALPDYGLDDEGQDTVGE